MKWLPYSLLLASSLCAASSPKDTPVPYDADLFKKDAQVYSLHGSFLFWRVQEGALDYALTMKDPAWSSGTNNFAKGDFQTATFNGDPGFRIAGSFFRAPHYWEIWASYTRMTARGENDSPKPEAGNEFVTGTWPQILTEPLGGASSKIHLNYNVGDVLVDRYFIPNPHLRLRLVGGATVAWMNQDWRIRYTDSLQQYAKIKSKWKYIGGGIRIGSMVDWFWGYDMYMTGTATTAILMGTYDNYTTQSTNAAISGGDPALQPRNVHYSDVRPVFSVQGILGPSWQKNYSCSRVEVFVGYELNAWFNLQEVYRSSAGTASASKETWMNTGMLALQGLTTRVTVDF